MNKNMLTPRNQGALVRKAIDIIGGFKYGAKARTAKELNITQSMIDRLANFDTPKSSTRVTPELAYLIERKTDGRITLNDFYKELQSAPNK